MIIQGACPHDCPDTCALRVTVEHGRAVRVAGDPDHPSTAGTLCTKVSRYTERTYSPDRLLTPLRRVGAKGEGRFEPIGWEQALDLIASRLKAIVSCPGSANHRCFRVWSDQKGALISYGTKPGLGTLAIGSENNPVSDRRSGHTSPSTGRWTNRWIRPEPEVNNTDPSRGSVPRATTPGRLAIQFTSGSPGSPGRRTAMSPAQSANR